MPTLSDWRLIHWDRSDIRWLAMENGLRRYWVEFDLASFEPAEDIGDTFALGYVRNGLGVTAVDLDDCLGIVRATVFNGATLPPVVRVVEDVDVSTLSVDTVVPNMEPPIWRGIWFPRGFSETRS